MSVPKPDAKAKQGKPKVRLNPTHWQVMAFVNMYRLHLNTRLAAIAAGYAPSNAAAAGSHLLNVPKVQEALSRAALEDFSLTTVRTADILRAASEIAYSDPIDYFDEHGNLLDICRMPRHARRAIASVKVKRENLGTKDGKTDQVIEIKWWPKRDGIDLLARHKGLLRDIVEHQVTVTAITKMSDAEFEAFDRKAREQYERALELRRRAGLLPPAQEG
jgi:hypothetical protein